MTEVRATLSANTFNANHAMAPVNLFCNGIFMGGLVEGGPTASRIKLGGGIE
jgi:hypothetical protein